MPFWLLKSEPEVYPWAQLVQDKRGHWDGVRNHQAANHLRSMQVGDQAFFYHSNKGLEIVGIMRITRTAYPDASDPSGRFVMVDVAPIRPLPHPVRLAHLKADPALVGMAMLRQSRLSVSPLTAMEWQRILTLGGVTLSPAEPA
jgi:predicted RNA-binding protein with PUA-like domain